MSQLLAGSAVCPCNALRATQSSVIPIRSSLPQIRYLLSFDILPHSFVPLRALSPAFSAASTLLPKTTRRCGYARHSAPAPFLSSHCAPPRKVPKFHQLASSQHAILLAPRRTQFRPFRCLTGKRTLGTAMPQRRSWSPAGLQSRDRTRKKAWVFRSPSERLARGCSSERPNCRKVRTPHRTGKAGSVRMG